MFPVVLKLDKHFSLLAQEGAEQRFAVSKNAKEERGHKGKSLELELEGTSGECAVAQFIAENADPFLCPNLYVAIQIWKPSIRSYRVGSDVLGAEVKASQHGIYLIIARKIDWNEPIYSRPHVFVTGDRTLTIEGWAVPSLMRRDIELTDFGKASRPKVNALNKRYLSRDSDRFLQLLEESR